MLGIINWLKRSIIGSGNKNNFDLVLDKINLQSNVRNILLNDYSYNLKHFSDSNNIGSDFEHGLMWMCISDYCKSVVAKNNINSNYIVFLGDFGVGKTTSIISYLKKFSIRKFVYVSNNVGSLELISRECLRLGIDVIDKSIANEDELFIFELDNVESASKLKNDYKHIKIICIHECTLSYDAFISSNIYIQRNILKVDGLIFTKSDFTDRVGIILDVCYSMSCRVIGINCGEASSNNLIMYDGSYINNIMSKLLIGNSNIDDTVKNILLGNIDSICLDKYKNYMSMILGMDNDKLQQIKSVATKLNSIGKININEQQITSALDRLLNNSDLIRKDMYIIDSMRRCEKMRPNIISDDRITKIAYGSNTNVDQVKSLIGKFTKFKSMMNNRDWLNMF